MPPRTQHSRRESYAGNAAATAGKRQCLPVGTDNLDGVSIAHDNAPSIRKHRGRLDSPVSRYQALGGGKRAIDLTPNMQVALLLFAGTSGIASKRQPNASHADPKAPPLGLAPFGAHQDWWGIQWGEFKGVGSLDDKRRSRKANAPPVRSRRACPGQAWAVGNRDPAARVALSYRKPSGDTRAGERRPRILIAVPARTNRLRNGWINPMNAGYQCRPYRLGRFERRRWPAELLCGAELSEKPMLWPASQRASPQTA